MGVRQYEHGTTTSEFENYEFSSDQLASWQ